jgi:tetratricopeptide (TPR) repeat protein
MMTTDPTKTVKLFFCYAREDRALRDELEQHLSLLKRQKQITTWYDREISPGTAWEKEIDTHLNSAHLILLLVSRDFLASDYCYGIEMKRALERHEAGTARVIPIILRPVFWKGAPFSKLQVLPTDARAVTLWPDRDQAFSDITENIHKTVEELQLSFKTKEEPVIGNQFPPIINKAAASGAKLPKEETLTSAYIQIKNGVITSPEVIRNIAAGFQAIANDPVASNNANFDAARAAQSLYERARLNEAQIFEQAIRLDPNNAYAYNNKSAALNELKRYEEALAACEQAIRLDPNYVYAYNNKGIALNGIKRYEEALAAYDQAIRLDPNFAIAYSGKGYALEHLGRKKDAQQAFERARQLGYNG